MKQVYRFNENGFYIEPVLISENDDIPLDCTNIKPNDGLYKAKFINGQWNESLTDDEINAIKNTPIQPTEIETLKAKQDLMQQALDDIILGGAL
jgi:hypothetical protein